MAEGLIPFVYRALKRRKGLRRYNTLPSASASAAAGAAALAIVAAGRIPEDHAVDYHSPTQYRNQQHHHHRRHSVDAAPRPWTPSTLQLGAGSARKDDGQHRRWATVDDFEYEEEYRRQQQYGYGGGDLQQQQQPPLAKARSSRVFSCITGM